MPGGWTVEEKYDVLIRVLKATGTFGKIPWGNFEPPEGRTLKACKHVMDSIKRELGLINSTGSGHPKEGADKSPVKGKKRKAGDTAEEGVEAAEVPRKKRGRPPKKDKEAKVKEEASEGNTEADIGASMEDVKVEDIDEDYEGGNETVDSFVGDEE